MASTKPKITYQDIKQGVEVLWSADDPAVDIVAVPGLGTDPKNCWGSNVGKPNEFNWLDHKDGLKKDFLHNGKENNRIGARVLLYHSESAWLGSLKVKPELHHLAYALLEGLKGERKEAERRPIVFIGHSMGGLVIAKALCIARSKPHLFPNILEATTGAIFFGTPFEGTPVAVFASLVDSVGSLRNATAGSSLLDLMKPDNLVLKELRRDFLSIAQDDIVGASMKVFCFTEEQPINLEKMSRKLFGVSWFAPNELSYKMVPEKSARLEPYEAIALAKNHSSMVTFDGWKDPAYKLIRGPIERIVRAAPGIAKSRFLSVRGHESEVKAVSDALEGVISPKKMYHDLQKEVQLSDPSWILKEKEYASWLNVTPDSPATRCLWIRGTEGRGKSSAVVSIIDQMKAEEGKGHSQPLYAFFFCGSSHETLTVEDMLKSLLFQLIKAQTRLFAHAKHFVPSEGKTAALTPTFENLWYSLVSIFSDSLVDKVYLIVHNLHDLPQSSDGTKKLLKKLQDEINVDLGQRRSKVRWLFTSHRSNLSIQNSLRGTQTYEINLDDKEKYKDQVGNQLRQHADNQVKKLSDQKKYNRALAYFTSTLMGNRAQDTVWIDITCLRLAQIPPNTKETRIRRELAKIPEDLDQLLDSIWSKLLNANDDDTEDVKELLRVLVLVKEPVALDELAILTGFTIDDVQQSLDKCSLLVETQGGKVVFVLENQVKEHLLKRSEKLLQVRGEEELKWQHGVLASRCFIYLVERFQSIEHDVKIRQDKANISVQAAAPETAHKELSSDTDGPASSNFEQEDSPQEDILAPDHSDSDGAHEGNGLSDSEGDSSAEAPVLEESNPYKLDLATLLHYPIKHWLYHSSLATKEFAERMSSEDEFWSRDSIFRKKWLSAYAAIAKGPAFAKGPALRLLKSENFTALHTAASLGYPDLVAELMAKGHEDERDVRDSMFNTPLHLAAFWGRTAIVEELLSKNAPVDDGIEDNYDTPLAMAAANGQVGAMSKLLEYGAEVNAVSRDWGPVINCAIYSGNKDAVALLVNKNAILSVSRMSEEARSFDIPPPLSLAALCSDLEMFDFLLQRCHADLSTQDYEAAFKWASRAGNTDVMERLILLPEFKAEDHDFQPDLDAAVEAEEWDSVEFLARNEISREKANFDKAVIALVQDVDDNLGTLEAIGDSATASLTKGKVNEALYIATDKEKEKIVNLLLTKFEADANATGPEFGDALTAAAHDGTIEIVKMLLDKGAIADSPTGWALQIAAGKGHIDVVHRLLEAGAVVNRVINNPRFPPCTALQAACEGGYDNIVELLLNNNADPDAGGGLFRHPIVAAARFGYADILSMLINKGANVNVKGGSSNESPLIFAATSLYVDSVIELINRGADIHYADDDGDIALVAAALFGDADLVTQLLKRGSNVMHVNKRGVNALQAAIISQSLDCVKVLGDWISLLLLGIQKAVDAEDEAPIQEILTKTRADHVRLRREVVERQEAASEVLGGYATTDFLISEYGDVDGGAGLDGVRDRSVARDTNANAETNDDELHHREAGGNGTGSEDEDREYDIVQRTAQMRLSDDGSRSMPRSYGEDDTGNGSDAGDGDVENREEGEEEAGEGEEGEGDGEGEEGEEGEEGQESYKVDDNDMEGNVMDDDEHGY
ncbi:hypothetical protein N0V85_008601 [Neurospora sp. IMI 360204]|nr:hypothetical protein N0V85_008601 [Neurospora sp. IMI 360204]